MYMNIDHDNNKIKLVINTLDGLNDALILEVNRFGLEVLENNKSHVIVSGNAKKIIHFIRSSQISENITLYFGKMKKDFSKIILERKLLDYMNSKSITFKLIPIKTDRVHCSIIGKILENNYSLIPELDNPNIKMGLFENGDSFILGLMVYKKEVSKRDYKVYPSRQSSSPLLYASLLEMADIAKQELFVDPLCQDGSFAIEYALRFSNKTRYHEEHLLQKDLLNVLFDLEKYDDSNNILIDEKYIFCSDEQITSLSKAKQNARLAGVERNISFGRIPIEFLQLKHEPNSVAIIATKLPLLSKAFIKKKYEKLVILLLKNARIILKKNGKLLIISNELESLNAKLTEFGFNSIKIFEYGKGESHLYCFIILNKGVKK
jgi:23S rRNA G2445 N2-methylase RlmL